MPETKDQKKKPAVPKDQWDLPVSFAADGEKMVTLKEASKQAQAVLSLPKLSDEQRVSLVVARINAQKSFELGSIGSGVVSKERAIKEVQAGTALGKQLMSIEQRVIQKVMTQAAKAE